MVATGSLGHIVVRRSAGYTRATSLCLRHSAVACKHISMFQIRRMVFCIRACEKRVDECTNATRSQEQEVRVR